MKPREFGDGFRRKSLLARPDLPIIGGAPPPLVLDRFNRPVEVGDEVVMSGLDKDLIPAYRVEQIAPHPNPEAAAKGVVVLTVSMRYLIPMQGGVPAAGIMITVPYEPKEVATMPVDNPDVSEAVPVTEPAPVTLD